MRGSFKKHPERRKEREFEPRDLQPLDPTPPEDLPEEAIPAWNQIVREAPAGVLMQADRVAVQHLATLVALSRKWIILEDATGAKYAARPVSDGQMGQMLKLLGQFGMTPADRCKLSVPKKSTSNPFEKIVN